MTARSYFLALDQGGHASRALLFDASLKIAAQAFCPIDTATVGERIEHDPEQLVASVHRVAEEVLVDLDPSDTVTAGLATQRSSIVCWSRHDGQALSPVLSWQDRRTAAAMHRFDNALEREEIAVRTGLVPSPHYGASKLRWCLDHLVDVAAHAARGTLAIGPLATFLNARLLDERPHVCDPANASRTLLWNIDVCDWDPLLLTLFGVPLAPLPRSVDTRFNFGHLAAAGRRVPLVITTGDQSATVFAHGKPSWDHVFVNMGTGAFIQRPLSQRARSVPGLLTSIVYKHRDEKVYTLEGTVNGAGSALQWLADEEGYADWEAQIEQWLNDTDPRGFFLNGIGGLAAPFWRPDFVSRFVGPASRAEKFVAVAESILFLITTNLQRMQVDSPPIENIVISGGIAASNAVCQRLADLGGCRVIRPQSREATARGVANLIRGFSGQEPQTAQDVFTARDNPVLRQRFTAWTDAMNASL